MYVFKIVILLFLTNISYAETTGNLILNGTFENNNSNNWTTSGDVQVLGDCCGSNYDLEFGDSGSIEQSFVLISDDITQPMLNNGITLNSSVQVQNGECGVSGCWGGSGPADTFTIRLQIRDSDSNVLATTTQERTNVTGINGKDFTDSVSYTGIGSNIGNIFLSGSDGNSPANLGGPNLDNISVTMTYDPTVLSSTQTSHITTTFQEIEEVLFSKVERVEFIPIEEFTFEVYEEPVVQMFEEIYIEEIAKEEINIGTVNIFKEIPMEVSYEEPKTIETFTTEVESFEETTETTEITGGEPSEQNQPIERNSNVEEKTIVASNSEKKSGGTERVSEEENFSTTETEPSNETEANPTAERENTRSEERVESESETSTDTDTVSRDESNAEVSEVAERTVQLDVEDITRKVEQTVNNLDQQLVMTQTLIAKVMNNNDILKGYNSVNQQLFDNQVDIYGGNVDEYIRRNYSDTRRIYDENKITNNDLVFQYETKVQEAVDQRIRAEEHLRRIRGY